MQLIFFWSLSLSVYLIRFPFLSFKSMKPTCTWVLDRVFHTQKEAENAQPACVVSTVQPFVIKLSRKIGVTRTPFSIVSGSAGFFQFCQWGAFESCPNAPKLVQTLDFLRLHTLWVKHMLTFTNKLLQRSFFDCCFLKWFNSFVHFCFFIQKNAYRHLFFIRLSDVLHLIKSFWAPSWLCM